LSSSNQFKQTQKAIQSQDTMQKQDDPLNPPGPLTGQGEDEVMVKTVLSDDDNNDNNVQTFTFSSTKEGAATQEGTDVQEDVNGPTRDLLSEEV
jgi:hypothetical protein